MTLMRYVNHGNGQHKAAVSADRHNENFFGFTCDVFSRAEVAVLHICPISFEPVRNLTRAVSLLYSALDRTNNVEAEAARLAWRLRATVLFTLLPFDHPALSIRELSDRLVHVADTLPAARHLVAEINVTIKLLTSMAENPKWNLLNELCSRCNPETRIGLLTALCPGPVPGWPREGRDLLTTIPDRTVSAIESRRNLKYSTFDTIILPAGLRHCAPQLATDIVHGCRARETYLLKYESEPPGLPDRPVLPAAVPFKFARPKKIAVASTVDIPQEVENVDQWLTENFWVNHRPEVGQVGSQHEETEPARFTVFLNGCGAFLPDEGKVIEISELFDGQTGAAGDDLPRKRVSLLEEGDLVVIRTSGGGDYVELVADVLIRRANRAGLRESALSWKPALRAALRGYGASSRIATEMRKQGRRVPFPAYLHNWAGDVVMSPQRQEDFVALIQAVADIGGELSSDPVQFAKTKWREMEELKSFHHRAGQQIRRELLTKVNELAASRKTVETEIRISLPHAEGGEMSVLRIAAIDRLVVDVPRSRLFRLEQTAPV